LVIIAIEVAAVKTDSMFIEKTGSLYDIHPSIYIDKNSGLTFLKQVTNVAIMKKAPLHIWFHLWNFGFDIKSIQDYVDAVFLPFLKFAEEKHTEGVLDCVPMVEAKEKIKVKPI
jgi:hypothetical protein